MTTSADLGKAELAGRGRRRITWTRGRRVTFGVIGFGSLLIALTGFVGSYTAVRNLAVRKGFGWFANLFPLGIDIGIIVMLSLDLALTWVDLRYPLLRHIAWLLTVATVAFNAMATYPDMLASAMHGTIPLLFIAITEAVRHAIETATARDAGREDYALSLGRWVLAPWSTWLIWRSRKLWPSTIPSYEVALELYQKKLEYRQELRDAYGWRWRRKARREELRPLRRSRLGYAVRPAGSLVPAPAQPGVPDLAPDAARPCESLLGRPLPAIMEQSPESPADHSHPQSPKEPASDAKKERALDHPREDLLANDAAASAEAEGSDDEPAAGASSSGEMDDDEEDEAADDAVDEDDGSIDPLPTIDLGTALENESKRQRAERIYLAHQKAGVELSRKNLTRWAGYQKAGSGRSAYVELERKHGPIVVRADEPDHALHEELSPVHS